MNPRIRLIAETLNTEAALSLPDDHSIPPIGDEFKRRQGDASRIKQCV